MGFDRLTLPLVIRGNGARLRTAAGLKYGTFDARTGRATRRASPNYRDGELATPYRAMIYAERCRDRIEISDLELDGGLAGLEIGGPYGDTGWQLPAIGIYLLNNAGPEIVRDVWSHHHALDGTLIDGLEDRAARSRLERCRFEYNGRQGVSLIGGRGYDFADCRFAHTGRAGLLSAPGAGIDIEAEGGKRNRDMSFRRCAFVDNAGVGMLVAGGVSEQARFDDCLFVGTTTYGAWPVMAHARFAACRFAGAVANVYGDADPARANRFADCVFNDDVALSPTRRLYLPQGDSGAVVEAANGRNALFDRCRFEMTGGGLLPWSVGTVYRDCRMRQRSRQIAYPRGRYEGRNLINGAVDLYGSCNAGELIWNGKPATLGGC